MRNFLLAAILLFITQQVFSQTITLGSLSSINYCTGSNISVPFTSTGFASGTDFTVTLRKGTTIINIASSTTSPINIVIPYNQNYGYGTDYNVQVSSGAVSSLASPNLQVGNIYTSEIVDADGNNLYSTFDNLCTGKTKVYYAKNRDYFGTVTVANLGLNYQWNKDGVNFTAPGVYVAGTLPVSANGVYSFVTTEFGCYVTSSNAVTLTVGTSSYNATNVYGDEVACTGTTKTLESNYYSNTATYQWQKDGVNISGATNRNYAATTSGLYKSTMIDGACTYTASERRLNFGGSLLATIFSGNGDTTLCTGNGVSRTLFATYYSSTPNQYTYQWKKDGVNINGAINRSYDATQGGVYNVMYSQGNCASNSRDLTILSSTTSQKPIITSGAINSVCSGNIILNQNINGVSSYIGGNWFKDGVLIRGVNSYTYAATASGTYKLINGYGTSCANESNAVTVNIGTTFTPQIYINSGTTNNLCGTSDYKYISFDNRNLGGTYTYQWIKDGVDIVGSTANELFVNSVGNYTLRVTNGTCTVVSNAIVITNTTPTATISASENNLVCANKMVRLDLKGAANFFNTPITWQRSGITIAGETSPFLYVFQGGNYTASYSQNGCVGTSSTLALSIVQPPLISVAPVSINSGQTATLSVTGCPGGAVTWYDALEGGTLLNTGSSYTTPPLPASITFYAYCVGLSCPSVKRVPAIVNVTQLQTITLSNPSPANICPGSSFSVDFTTSGVFNGGNTFQVQLSDLNGNFTLSPTVLATGISSPITVNLDANTPTSANYKIRVVSTDPLSASSPSNFISINNTPTISSNAIITCNQVTLQTPNLSGRTYQWQRNGVDIALATNVTYSTSNAGVYTLVSTVGTCVKTSSPIQLYSYSSSAFVSVPAGSTFTFCSGTSLVITANPNNPASTYQWRKDGVDISGATASTYAATLAGAYSVRITQGTCFSVVTSTSSTLSTVTGANSLDNTAVSGGTDASANYNAYFQPFNICSGSMILSTSQRSASSTFQWQLDGVDISGETNATYTASQTGYYSVKIAQGACTGVTTPVALRIGSLTPPLLNADISICTGATYNIFNSSTQGRNCCGTGLSYQWIKDGVDIPSVISPFSYLANTAGLYTLRVSQGACTSTSAPLRLTIGTAIASPIINEGFINEVACSGSSSQLSGGSTLTSVAYQWIKDGVDIPLATANFYNTTQTGKYQVRFTQGTCSATSNEVQQIFGELGNPTISGNSRFCGSATTTLSASSACGDYTYQWKRNGIAISGATLSTYTTNVPAVYTLDITKGTKTITTSSFSVYEDCSTTTTTSINTPFITSYTSDRTICAGNGKQMIFTANQSSTYPTVTYQWYKDGVLLVGQTSRFFFITDAGNYQVQLIVGTSQSALSSVFTMYNSGNNIVVNTANGTFGCTEVLLSSTIPNLTTKLPYTYQWKKDGVNIGTNQNFYTTTASGNYTLEATLGTCTISSSAIPITIGNASPSVISSPSSNRLCDNGYVTLNTNLGSSFVHQWYKDNVLIPNINARSYTATTVGNYTFTATQGACTYSSTAVPVTSTSSLIPSIGFIGGFSNSSNLSLSACNGSNTTLTINPKAGIYQYQWKNAGLVIAGANTATYQPTAIGTYSADITTLGGCVVASPILTLDLGTTPSPSFTNSSLSGSNLCNGSTVNLNVGYGNFSSYQWYKDDVLIPSATSTVYSASLAGRYNVKMTQGACNVETNYIPVSLSSTTLTPRVTSASTTNNVSCNLISASLFASSVNGGTYQWQRNGVNVAGAVNTFYNPTQNGTYQIIVNQGTCTGTSNPIEIQNGVASIIFPNSPFGYICGEGASILTNFISNTGTYQWKKDGVNIGTNSSFLSINGLGTYTVTNTVNGCSSTSQPFIVSSISPMESAKTGLWNNSGVWNCLRTPNISDNIKVNLGHIVSLPNTSTYLVKSINNVGNVSFGTGSNLRIGF